MLSSDATLEGDVATGDPTEVALLALADHLKIDREILEKNHTRMEEFPFDSDRKLMSVQVKDEQNSRIYTK